MRDTFARTLHQVAQQNPDVYLLAADISPAGSMAPFRDQFPEQFVNVGVAEQNMVGMCAGLALRGCIPFAYTISVFTIYRPFEQIRVDLCYQNLPVTLVGIGGGVSYSTLGSTHHTQEDIAVMSALPNMSIIAPCDPSETEAATWACAAHDGPVYLRLGRAGEPDLTADAIDPFEFGKLRRIREGGDVCIISYGPIMQMCFDIAGKLEETGRKTALISAHTLKPLDRRGISDVLSQYEHVVVVEEHSPQGGLGPQVKEIAWDESATCKLQTFSLKDEFIHLYGQTQELWKAHGLSADEITGKIIGG